MYKDFDRFDDLTGRKKKINKIAHYYVNTYFIR